MLVKLLYQVANLGYPVVKKILTYQVYLYLFTGAINTFLSMGLFALAINLWNSTFFVVEIATIFSFIITIFTGFWLSKNFAFKQDKTNSINLFSQFKKYVLVALQGQVNGYFVTKALVVMIGIKPIIAYIVTAIIMLTLNYFLQKYYSFKTVN